MSCGASWSARFHVHEGDLTAAHHAQAYGVPGAGYLIEQGLRVVGRAAADAEQYVADQQAGPPAGTFCFDGGDHEPGLRGFPVRATQGGGQLDRQYPYAQAGASSPCPRKPGARRVARYREREAAEDHGVYPDDLAPRVEERSTGVSRRQGDVGPEVSRPSAGPARHLETAHDTGGHRPEPAPRMTDSVDQLPDAQFVGVSDRNRRQVAGEFLEAEQRQVELPAALDDLGFEGIPVVHYDLYPRRAPSPGDHVVVRQDEAVSAPDHTSPGPAAPGAHLNHALVGAPDHLRARRRLPAASAARRPGSP